MGASSEDKEELLLESSIVGILCDDMINKLLGDGDKIQQEDEGDAEPLLRISITSQSS